MDEPMHGQIKGPQVLLKHLREAMAEPLGPQERLNRIVQQIAAAMMAQVCSVYARRADDVLELFATFGLNEQAVHQSQLKVGEGLVGTIAAAGKPMNLAEAQSHPAFRYLPETGEENYRSFLGVPLKRAGKSLGVLVVQTIDTKHFAEDEIEALENAAMVLADLVSSQDLSALAQPGKELVRTLPISVSGTALSGNIAIGKVVRHEPRVVITRFFNQNPTDELNRLASALKAMRASVDAMVDQGNQASTPEHGSDHLDILESYRMFAHDRGWVRRLELAIQNGLTAEAAVEKISQENRDRILASQDPYLRDRLSDFDDLARRLLKMLIGEPVAQNADKTDEPIVVVARSMGAAELMDYKGPGLKGLVLSEATATSHVVIVARAMGIAVVGGPVDLVESAEQLDTVIVDGFEGIVHLRPAEGLRESYQERIAFRAEKAAEFERLKDVPALTSDGVKVDLLLNAGLTMDLPQLDATGAEGVGLFRTELQFMVSSTMPRLGEQTAFYKSILEAADGREITFRTLDIGGDKVLPYLRTVKEDNPAMGWRALRLFVDRPGLLRMQLRALIKAAAGHRLRIKLPMVTTASEVDHVRVALDRELATVRKFGHEVPDHIELGAMIEVPNLLWQLDELMQKVDFVSVGSNDLFQFMTASDRTNAYIENRFQPLSRSFLRALRGIVVAADHHNKPLQLCGELAGDPISALALLGIGYRKISMPAISIGPIKQMVRQVNMADLSAVVLSAIEDQRDNMTMPELLNDYADQNGIPL